MKRVVAVVRPAVVADVQAVLDDDFPELGMTVAWAEGCGRQKGHTEVYRGAEYAIDLVPKLRIEIVCEGSDVEDIVELVAAR